MHCNPAPPHPPSGDVPMAYCPTAEHLAVFVILLVLLILVYHRLGHRADQA